MICTEAFPEKVVGPHRKAADRQCSLCNDGDVKFVEKPGFSPEPKKIYFLEMPFSYSTRTGAMVFVLIDRRTRTVSLRQ
jgi:hypothetical protein